MTTQDPTRDTPGRTVRTPDERREEILVATRQLFAERGIAKTTISDIAARVGITRGLVYHYFEDKDTLVDAILDAYVDEFVESVQEWDAARVDGDIEGALTGCIELFRRQLRPTDPLRAGLQRAENAAVYNQFVDRAVTAVVDCFSRTTVEAYARRHDIAIRHVRETFYVLVYGLIALVRAHPETEDRVLIGIIRQTLALGPPPSDPTA